MSKAKVIYQFVATSIFALFLGFVVAMSAYAAYCAVVEIFNCIWSFIYG